MKTPSKWLQNTLLKLHSLCDQERRIGVEILELLWGIEQRKSYSELKYDGLYSFCIREFKWSESQAFQRIQAMWALKAVPEVKEKIKLGTLSITTVAQIQTFIRHEQKQGIQRTPDQKLELFSHFENKTSKEVKSEILELHGKPELTKLNLELDLETQAMWMEVRERSAHLTQGDPLQCFRLLLKDWLSQQNKCARSKVIINTTQACPTQNTHQNTVQTVNDKTIRQSGPLSTQVQRNISWSTKQARSRYITLATKSEVLQRDQNKCRNCDSRFALQFEHIIPFAMGGTNDASNLKLLCRNCNLHRGVKEFGMGAMRRQ